MDLLVLGASAESLAAWPGTPAPHDLRTQNLLRRVCKAPRKDLRLTHLIGCNGQPQVPLEQSDQPSR